jgi:hypothetical protein
MKRIPEKSKMLLTNLDLLKIKFVKATIIQHGADVKTVGRVTEAGVAGEMDIAMIWEDHEGNLHETTFGIAGWLCERQANVVFFHRVPTYASGHGSDQPDSTADLYTLVLASE